MNLVNYTDIPIETIRAVIRSVCPANITNMKVQVGNCTGQGGRGVAFYYRNYIKVNIAKTEQLARFVWKKDRYAGKGYLEVGPVGSRMETLVMVMAHELRHLWQAKVRKGWRVWGSRGVFSERDADAYGMRMLRRFRRGELEVKPEKTVVLPPVIKKVAKSKPRDSVESRVRVMAGNLNVAIRGPGAEVEAPQGYRFAGTSSHWLHPSVHGRNTEYWQSLEADLSDGVEQCEKDCDVCYPELEAVG